MKPFSKEPATIDAQLLKLEERGCVVEDRKFARSVLTKINYYRLANYFAVYDTNGANKRYREGTSFIKVVRLYDFDRKLRGQLLISLEEIEISMRAVISNYHALKYGALGWLKEDSFHPGFHQARFMSRIERLIDTNKDIGFVAHYNSKHAGAFPLWVLMELFSFGMLAHFFSDMHRPDKKEIVRRHYGNAFSERHLESWLDSLAELRNHCAHYNRLYAAKVSPPPKTLEYSLHRFDDTLFTFIYIMRLLNYNNADSLVTQISALFEEYGDIIELRELGFPPNWEEILI